MNSDESAFLAAIIAAPDDDLPRLIYADYLDERGEAERAEFIRVQCELERTPASFHRSRGKEFMGFESWQEPNPKHEALRRRERELLASVPWLNAERHAYDTAGEPPVHRRGFVEEITCSWGDWRTHADAIRASTPLRKVRITDSCPDTVRLLPGNKFQHYGYPGIEFESQATHFFTGTGVTPPLGISTHRTSRDFTDILVAGQIVVDDPSTISAVRGLP